MADKMGMGDFLLRFRELCLDYQGFRHIAKHSIEPERWAYFLRDYRDANETRVYALFDELNVLLQRKALEPAVYRSLTDVIENVTS